MSITHGLHRWIQRRPERLATSFEGTRRSWAELGERVARLAGGLRSLGLARGERIAVLLPNRDSYLELYFASAWLGAAIVPLNTRWSEAENLFALSDCGPRMLVFDDTFAHLVPGLLKALPGLLAIHIGDHSPLPGLIDYEALIAGGETVPDVEAGPEELAGIFYTGGTTGRSKGVMLSHRNLQSGAISLAREYGDCSEDIYLHAGPMFHLGDVGVTFALMLSGAAHVMLRSFTPQGFAEAVANEGVTEAALVPTMLQMLIDSADFGSFDLGRLRRIAYAGSPMPPALLDRAMDLLPQVDFMQIYGMTELAPVATVLAPQDHRGAAREAGLHRSVGRATANVDVRIADPDGQTLMPGAMGEILVRGDNVMQGYWERPEETTAALAGGWMHTGDAGWMDQRGYVFLVDRVKDMIITGGENVYSAEVEACLAAHPAVMQCAVIGVPDPKWGETVHAVVVCRPGTSLEPAEIIVFCRERIAHYKCPRSAEVRSQPLPLSGVGKVMKQVLRQEMAARQT